jgi:N-acetylneuraminic acid mutarotase
MTPSYMMRLRAILVALAAFVIASSSLMAQWSDLPNLPSPRTWTQQAVVGTKLYVFGGFNGNVTSGDAWVLDIDNVEAGWTAISAMPETRAMGYATTVNNKIYIVGGVGNDATRAARGTVLEYDPTADTYTPRATMDVPTWASGYATAGTKIYSMGGSTPLGASFTPVTNTQIYDVVANSWTNGPALPGFYFQGNAAAIGNDVYYFGGLDKQGTSNYIYANVLKLAGGTGNWQIMSGRMGTPVYNGASGVLDGKIYVAGGSDGSADSRLTQVYDPVANVWSTTYPLPKGASATNWMPAMGESLFLAGSTANDEMKLTVGAPRAVASISPASVNIAAKVGGTSSRILSIANIGVLALTGNITVTGAPWLSVSPTNINIAAAGSDEFQLTADASSLAAGKYTGSLSVTTNDTENPTITVPVNLYVVENLVEQPTVAVLEEATGNWCPPCGASGTPEVRRLNNVYGERLISIAYHDRGGRPSEPMHTAQTEAMTARLGVPYWPAAAVQRIDWPEEDGLMTGAATWAPHIEAVLSQMPTAPASLEVLEYSYDGATKRVNAKIKITTADAIAFDGSSLNLTAVVLEDSLLYSQAGTTESPYYHMHVARSFWPNIEGQTLTLPAGSTADNGSVLLPGKEIIVDASWTVSGVVTARNAHVAWLLHLNNGAEPGMILQGHEMSLLGEAASGGGIITVTADAPAKTIAVGQTAVFNTTVMNITDGAIEVSVDRMSNALPATWTSQLCINDDCVPTTSNKVSTTVLPGESVVFKLKVLGATGDAQGVVGLSISAGDTAVSQTYTVNTGAAGISYETGSSATFGISAYPNPIVTTGRIEYAIPAANSVTLDLFSTSGEKVMTLVEGRREVGRHSVNVDLSSMPAGIYTVVLTTGDRKVTRTISVVR